MEIYTKDDAIKFTNGDYDTELLEYIKNNTQARQKEILAEDDYKHIAHCIKSQVAQLFGIHPCGDFGNAILRNDLFGAVGRADDTNILCLNLYTMFLHNCVPANLLIEARKPNKK